MKAAALEALGREDEADAVLETALARAPANPDLVLQAAGRYSQTGRQERALELSRPILATAPEEIASRLLEIRVTCHQSLKQLERGLAEIEKRPKSVRLRATCVCRRAEMHLALGARDAAIADLAEAHEIAERVENSSWSVNYVDRIARQLGLPPPPR